MNPPCRLTCKDCNKDRVPSGFITQGELKSHGTQRLRRTNLPQPIGLWPVTCWTLPERLIMLLDSCRTTVQLRLPTPATAEAPAHVLFFRLGPVPTHRAWCFCGLAPAAPAAQRKMASSFPRPGANCTFSVVSDSFRATSSLFRPPGAPPSNPPAFVPSGTRVN